MGEGRKAKWLAVLALPEVAEKNAHAVWRSGKDQPQLEGLPGNASNLLAEAKLSPDLGFRVRGREHVNVVR